MTGVRDQAQAGERRKGKGKRIGGSGIRARGQAPHLFPDNGPCNDLAIPSRPRVRVRVGNMATKQIETGQG